MKIKNNMSCLFVLAAILVSCNKDFLEKKPDQALLIPETVADLQALMDNINVMTIGPDLQNIASDDFYISASGLKSLNLPAERNAYVWAKDVYENTSISDWNRPYQQVLYCNIVLDKLKAIKENSAVNSIKGTAMFYRSLAFYNLLQLFSSPYSLNLAKSELGIPLHLTADVNDRPSRGNIQQDYDQIVNDLLIAKALLPMETAFKSRPTKVAASALLARIYLVMGAYSSAINACDTALNIQHELIDYNSLNTAATRPFPVALPSANNEVIFYSSLNNYSFNSSSATKVDTTLFSTYDKNDLRKVIFFNSVGNFKGSYTGNTSLFGGLATDELYLIRAECLARTGEKDAALKDLNTLLQKRYKTGTFALITSQTVDIALSRILAERRKELVGRGTRWTDLRRLNLESGKETVVKRNLDGNELTLTPNDKKYVFPIPDNEIRISGIQQNDR